MRHLQSVHKADSQKNAKDGREKKKCQGSPEVPVCVEAGCCSALEPVPISAQSQTHNTRTVVTASRVLDSNTRLKHWEVESDSFPKAISFSSCYLRAIVVFGSKSWLHHLPTICQAVRKRRPFGTLFKTFPALSEHWP